MLIYLFFSRLITLSIVIHGANIQKNLRTISYGISFGKWVNPVTDEMQTAIIVIVPNAIFPFLPVAFSLTNSVISYAAALAFIVSITFLIPIHTFKSVNISTTLP